jgi:putative FmdB family regulatory protein
MPIYEYQCDECGRRMSVLTMRVSEQVDAACRHCGSRKLSRLMSRFATLRSEERRLDALADPSHYSDVDENDPKSIARMMKRIGREMGEEVQGPEFDEAIEELERGGQPGAKDADEGIDGGEL